MFLIGKSGDSFQQRGVVHGIPPLSAPVVLWFTL
jgi:hypothetical protein